MSECSNDTDITDKVIIITGANTGIGYETALVLAAKGANVILACRNQARGEEALNNLKDETNSEKIYLELIDLGDLQSIRDFAKRFKAKWDRLDVLVNNAGLSSDKRCTTKDGFELAFGTNHLGHFLLTNLLLDLLKKSAPSRIINVSSTVYMVEKIYWDDLQLERSYNFTKSYGQSKLANILFTVELAKRLNGTGVTAVSLHPGILQTQFLQNKSGFWANVYKIIAKTLGKPVKEGTKTIIYCITDPSIPKTPGAFFNDCKLQNLPDKAKNETDSLRLWNISAELVQLEKENETITSLGEQLVQ